MDWLTKLKWDAVRKNLVVPSLTRVGTFVAGWTTAHGMPADSSHTVGLAVTAVALWLADLTVSYLARRELEKRVAVEAVNRVLSNPRGRL